MVTANSFAAPPAASNKNACLGNLQAVYEAEKDFKNTAFVNNDQWYLKYAMTATVLDPVNLAYKEVNSDGELIASPEMRQIKTGQMEVYMDKNDVFTVNRSLKVVMRMQSVDLDLLRSNAYFDLMSDSVLKKYKVIGCKAVTDPVAGATVKYDIAPVDKQSPFLKMSLYADKGNTAFKKMTVELNPAYTRDIKDYTISVKERSIKKNSGQEGTVKDKLMSADGKLKPPYNFYSFKNLKK